MRSRAAACCGWARRCCSARPLQANTLAHIRIFAALFLAPELAAWCVLRAFAARASVDEGALVLTRGARRLELATRDIAAVEPWRLPLPSPGAWLRMASGARWRYGLALADPSMLARSLAAGGAPLQAADATSRAATYAQARLSVRRGRLDRPWVKFVLFPLALALPAFRLHQHIAYGSAFGEFYTFGLNAYLTTFALWWAEWTIGVVLWAAALRAAIEAGSLLVVLLRPRQAVDCAAGARTPRPRGALPRPAGVAAVAHRRELTMRPPRADIGATKPLPRVEEGANGSRAHAGGVKPHRSFPPAGEIDATRCRLASRNPSSSPVVFSVVSVPLCPLC